MRAREFIREAGFTGPSSYKNNSPTNPMTYKNIGSISPTKVKWTNQGNVPKISPQPGTTVLSQNSPTGTDTTGLTNFANEPGNQSSASSPALSGVGSSFVNGFKKSIGMNPNQSAGSAIAHKALSAAGLSGTANTLDQLAQGSEIDMPKLGKVKVANQTDNEIEIDTKNTLGVNLRVNKRNIK